MVLVRNLLALRYNQWSNQGRENVFSLHVGWQGSAGYLAVQVCVQLKDSMTSEDLGHVTYKQGSL
jgi:hypothetical protein